MGLFNDKKDKEVESPISFTEDWMDNPLIWMNKEINGETNFAILKTTAGGKYMRGNRLFYSLNGVEVYTDPENIIFVDTVNKTLFIREYNKVIEQITPNNEDKQYILLYTDIGYENNEEEFPLRWEACNGREAAYDHIVANAGVIDIDKSLVLVDNVGFKDALSVRDFVNYLKNADYIEDDGFDINQYSGSEYL